MWCGIESNMVAYADDTTIYATIPSPRDRLRVANVLSRDISKILSWCDRWGMKLNPKKSHSIVIGRSRTSNPAHPDIISKGVPIPNCSTLKLLGIILDHKLTFEYQLRSLASSVSRKIGLLRKCRRIYSNDDIVRNCFYSFILPHFEYCPSVWISAAESHLKLLDRAFNQIKFILPNLQINLRHRRLVGLMSYFFKIMSNPNHPLLRILPGPSPTTRTTRQSLIVNDRSLIVNRYNTSQFSRCFIPLSGKLWNAIPNEIVNSANIKIFKGHVNGFLSQHTAF